ncbi:hypothetical protein [Rhodovulum euryhalinum]|nr:hypothetical protein [Rhodovulum euryhalinum]
MMLEADSLISESEEAGEWTARASTIPDLIRSYLPEPDAMFEMTDAEIIKLAQKASALAIHALESGSWQARDHMPFFAALQEYAEGLSAAVAA